MLGLPKSTETYKLLPKSKIYDKCSMNPLTKEKFDRDIKRITIVNELSPYTTSLAEGEISSIYVLYVSLKNKSFNENNIILLSKIIPQNMLFILEYEKESKLAIFHTKLIQSPWQESNNLEVQLIGLNLDLAWQNLILQVGNFELKTGNSLDEQIAIDEERQKKLKLIEQLESKIKATKQFNVQVKLKQEIQRLKEGVKSNVRT